MKSFQFSSCRGYHTTQKQPYPTMTAIGKGGSDSETHGSVPTLPNNLLLMKLHSKSLHTGVFTIPHLKRMVRHPRTLGVPLTMKFQQLFHF